MEKAVKLARKIKKWLQYLTIFNLVYFVAATSYWSSIEPAVANNITCFGNTEDADMLNESNVSCDVKNGTDQEHPALLSFVVNKVDDDYIVKYDGYYNKSSRLCYLDEALSHLRLNNSQWGILPHVGAANHYPSDFDVLQVDQSIKFEVKWRFTAIFDHDYYQFSKHSSQWIEFIIVTLGCNWLVHLFEKADCSGLGTHLFVRYQETVK